MLVESAGLFNIAHLSICMMMDDYLARYCGELEPSLSRVELERLKCEVRKYVVGRFGVNFDSRHHVERDMVEAIVDGLLDSGYLTRILSARELAQGEVL